MFKGNAQTHSIIALHHCQDSLRTLHYSTRLCASMYIMWTLTNNVFVMNIA